MYYLNPVAVRKAFTHKRVPIIKLSNKLKKLHKTGYMDQLILGDLRSLSGWFLPSLNKFNISNRKQGKYMKLVIFLAIALFGSALYAVPASEEKPKALVDVVKSEELQKKVLLPALVEPLVSSTVQSDLDGMIKKLNKSLGSQVKAGEIILYIENLDPAFTFNAVPVRSPVSGILTQIHSNLMSRVQKGEKLFTVTDQKKLKVVTEIPFNEIQSLKIGMKGSFVSNPLDKKNQFEIELTGLSPIINPQTGTSTAEIKFVNHDVSKLPNVGTVGQVSFSVSEGKNILIPDSAISYIDGKASVRIVDQNNKSKRKTIELGEQVNNSFKVLSGLSEGEKIIIRSSKLVKEGEEVIIEESPQQPKGTN
jgi:membrane fusion protein (multidrug efflux system)